VREQRAQHAGLNRAEASAACEHERDARFP
jgi:hypothetical protein